LAAPQNENELGANTTGGNNAAFSENSRFNYIPSLGDCHMKKPMVLGACALLLGLIALPAFADDSPTSCSLATLHGTMAYANVYWTGGVPSAGSAMESYDGMGHFKYHEVDSDGITTKTYDYHGTYTITANCIASVVYFEGGPVWTYFVAPDGSAYYWVNSQNAGTVSANHATRISHALLVQ